MLDIYISKFTSATLVKVTCLHVYMNATALKGLFNGWIAVLRGCEEEVSQFHRFSEDPLAPLGVDAKPEKWICWNNVVRGFRTGVHAQGVDREVVDADVGFPLCLRSRLVFVYVARDSYERIGRVQVRVHKWRRQ